MRLLINNYSLLLLIVLFFDYDLCSTQIFRIIYSKKQHHFNTQNRNIITNDNHGNYNQKRILHSNAVLRCELSHQQNSEAIEWRKVDGV
jgi:hypothetical protein